MKLKNIFNYFSLAEKLLWSCSALLIIASFLIFDNENYLTLINSLIGITSIIFCAKGNPFGQALGIVFGVIYSIISLEFAYYGEAITYLGMSVPTAAFVLITWLRNPFEKGRAEVTINKISKKEYPIIFVLAAIVTVVFYFILRELGTANLLPSTVSVTTSFIAVCLAFRRSPYFSIAYAANDLVLIILWTLAAAEDISYLSVIICFIAFFANDIYCFINWRKIQKKQAKKKYF